MTNDESTPTPQIPKSARFDQLLLVLNRSLSESRKAFDTKEAVQECYGDDAAMFNDGSSDNVLVSAIDAMVDRVNEKVQQEMLEFLEREQVQQRLARVEAIINQFDRCDQEQKEVEANDRKAAREALDAARLPKDVSPEDVIKYQTYKLMEKERESLLNEIACVEGETKQLDEKIQQSEGRVGHGVKHIETFAQAVEKSASVLEAKSEEDISDNNQ